MTDEEKWFRRLRRVIDDMPKTVEVQVHQNIVQMNWLGAMDTEFERAGHVDSVEPIDWFQTKRFYPCSESI